MDYEATCITPGSDEGPANVYGNVHVANSARAIVGNVYNFNEPQPESAEVERKRQ